MFIIVNNGRHGPLGGHMAEYGKRPVSGHIKKPELWAVAFAQKRGPLGASWKLFALK